MTRFLFSSSCSLYGGRARSARRERRLQPGDALRPFEGASRAGHLHAGRRRLQPDLPAQRHRLRRLAAPARGPGREQPRRLCPHDRRDPDQSDGTPWRPLVHVEDISSAFLAALDAPRELVHDEAFNVGASAENYRIREVAEIVEEVVPGARASFADGGGPDKRCYRVDCSKIARVLPAFKPQWTVAPRRRGAVRASAERADVRRVHRHPLPAHQPRARAAGRRPARRRAALAGSGRAGASSDDLHPDPARGRHLIDLERRADERGFLARMFCEHEFAEHGLAMRFVQSSTIQSPRRNTLRGLHYQEAPHRETKLVRCTRGVDLPRHGRPAPGSATRHGWLGVELTPETERMPYVPEGFAQGYQTLEDDTEVSTRCPTVRARVRPRRPLGRPGFRHRVAGRRRAPHLRARPLLAGRSARSSVPAAL